MRASRFRDSGHDLDIYALAVRRRRWSPNAKPARTALEGWLGEYDALFLKRNNAAPLVVPPVGAPGKR